MPRFVTRFAIIFAVLLQLFAYTASANSLCYELFNSRATLDRLLGRYQPSKKPPSLGLESEVFTATEPYSLVFALKNYLSDNHNVASQLVPIPRGLLDENTDRAIKERTLVAETGSGPETFAFKHEVFIGDQREALVSRMGESRIAALENIFWEVNSPIMRDHASVDRFLEVMEYLTNRFNIRARPEYGAVQVHADFRGSNLSEIYLFVSLWKSLEGQLYDHFHTAAERIEFNSLPLDPRLSRLLFLLERASPLISTEEGIGRIFEEVIRLPLESSISLAALNVHGSIELRIFNGTVDPKLMRYYLQFTSALVSAVRSQDPRLIGLLRSKDFSIVNHQFSDLSLREVLEAVGIDTATQAWAETRIKRDYRAFAERE